MGGGCDGGRGWEVGGWEVGGWRWQVGNKRIAVDRWKSNR